MRKKLVRASKSKFYQVACKKCNNNQTIFSKASTEVRCLVCGEVLAVPTGGEAHITGKITGVFD